MKILVISDIHANYNALLQLKDLIEGADKVFCLGDYIGYNKDVNEVINFIRSYSKFECILGNHDFYLLKGMQQNINEIVKNGIKFAQDALSKDNFEWLKELPIQKELIIDDKTFLLCHGSPQKIDEYLYIDNIRLEFIKNLNYDVVFYGHTHIPFYSKNYGKILANPGSVGQSRHLKNKCSALIYDTISDEIKFIDRNICNKIDLGKIDNDTI